MTPDKLPLELTEGLCARLKNLYLQTDLGTLDCLAEVAGVGGYEEALSRSITFRLSYGEFHILNIDALIDAKQAAARPHDLEAVRYLRAIKEQNERSKS